MKIKILNYRHKKLWAIMSLIFIGVVLLPSMALAEEAPVLSSGDTAWMLTATALVLLLGRSNKNQENFK